MAAVLRSICFWAKHNPRRAKYASSLMTLVPWRVQERSRGIHRDHSAPKFHLKLVNCIFHEFLNKSWGKPCLSLLALDLPTWTCRISSSFQTFRSKYSFLCCFLMHSWSLLLSNLFSFQNYFPPSHFLPPPFFTTLVWQSNVIRFCKFSKCSWINYCYRFMVF